jgi:hypothetical protein
LSGRFIPATSEDEEGLIVASTVVSTPGTYIFTIHRGQSGTLWFGHCSGAVPLRQGCRG